MFMRQETRVYFDVYGALETTGRDFEEIMSYNKKVTGMLK